MEEANAARGGIGAPSSGAVVRWLRANGILVALLVLVVVGALLSPAFLTISNLANVARQASIVGIIGVGMTFVILTAGIDLSVGCPALDRGDVGVAADRAKVVGDEVDGR